MCTHTATLTCPALFLANDCDRIIRDFGSTTAAAHKETTLQGSTPGSTRVVNSGAEEATRQVTHTESWGQAEDNAGEGFFK